MAWMFRVRNGCLFCFRRESSSSSRAALSLLSGAIKVLNPRDGRARGNATHRVPDCNAVFSGRTFFVSDGRPRRSALSQFAFSLRCVVVVHKARAVAHAPFLVGHCLHGEPLGVEPGLDEIFYVLALEAVLPDTGRPQLNEQGWSRSCQHTWTACAWRARRMSLPSWSFTSCRLPCSIFAQCLVEGHGAHVGRHHEDVVEPGASVFCSMILFAGAGAATARRLL